MPVASFIKSIKGFFIGIALVIPGLSGSFFSVVVGLYEPIVKAVVNIRKDFRASAGFLLPVAVGCVLGILLSAKGLLWVCVAYPSYSYIFFTGLVLGSFPVVFKKIRQKPYHWLYGIILCISFVFIVGMAGAKVEVEAARVITRLGGLNDIAVLLWAGLFACSFMMIPGVSGSILLMVTGQYETVYQSVGAVLDFFICIMAGDFQKLPLTIANIFVLAPFILGAGIGVLLIARCMNFLLQYFETAVYYGVLGMAVGSVYILWQLAWQQQAAGIFTSFSDITWLHVLFLLVGVACTYFLDIPKSE